MDGYPEIMLDFFLSLTHTPMRQVEFCETTCLEKFKTDELYVRVLQDNDAAKEMYKNFGYEVVDNPGDPEDVILMKKDLKEPS